METLTDEVLMINRFYYNGELKAETRNITFRALIRCLDAYEKQWSKNLMPQVKPGEFDPNNGSIVERISQTELFIITTGGHKLRWRAAVMKTRNSCCNPKNGIHSPNCPVRMDKKNQ